MFGMVAVMSHAGLTTAGGAGSPKLARVAQPWTWLPQNIDQGMPVTAKNKITMDAKAPVTACRSRQKRRVFGDPRTVTTPAADPRGHHIKMPVPTSTMVHPAVISIKQLAQNPNLCRL